MSGAVIRLFDGDGGLTVFSLSRISSIKVHPWAAARIFLMRYVDFLGFVSETDVAGASATASIAQIMLVNEARRPWTSRPDNMHTAVALPMAWSTLLK